MRPSHAATPGPSDAPVEPGLDRSLFEASPDCVKLLDASGRLLEMNRNGRCAMEVEDFEALRGRDWFTLWPEQSHEQLLSALQAARAGGTARFTAFCPTARGTPRWWDVTVTSLPGAGPGTARILSVSRDITQLHQAQEQQLETAARLQLALDAAQLGEWELDEASGQARTSALHDRCFGYAQPVQGWSYARMLTHVHPEDLTDVKRSGAAAMAGGDTWRFECRVVWPDGSVHWIQSVAAPYRREGQPRRWVGTVQDVTARKQVEQDLRDATQRALQSAREAEVQRRRLNALLDSAPVGIVCADHTGRVELVNAANYALWGDRPGAEDVSSHAPRNGWWADGSERHGRALEPHEWGLPRALRGEEVRQNIVEIEPLDGAGTRKTVLLHASPVRGQAGEIVGAVAAQMDITHQVRTEAQLRQSEAKFRTIADAMPQMVWSTRPDGYHDYYNRQWYEFTGAPAGSTEGEGWNGMFHPQDQPLAWERWRHSLATGEVYEIEYRLRHRDGEYRWVLGRALPVHDDTGRIVRWMGTCTDIHAHKLAQQALERSEESLRQADRRKDEFLAMLAHELRNPLAPISTAAELLRRAVGNEAQVARASTIIARQVQHMSSLVNDLLDVSRVTRGLIKLREETVDLRQAAQEAVEQARPLLQARQHRLQIDTGAEPLWVRGDRTRLIQILSNLLNNAAKYTPAPGTVTLAGRRVGEAVQLSVQDSGVGIDPGLLPHVFELFTQAERNPDRSEGGLGLGLALVRSLVELHGGSVRADSAGPGQGSTFTVTLPATQPGQARQAATAPVGEPAARSAARRVVVVDDNEDAALTLASLLEAEGHIVSTYGSGEALLDRLHEVQADAFILDIGLPGMTGHEVGRRLRAQPVGRSARIYALSGYGQEQDRAASITSGFDGHFVKPVDPRALMEALQG